MTTRWPLASRYNKIIEAGHAREYCYEALTRHEDARQNDAVKRFQEGACRANALL
jgi:cellobiose-specific phosphotransferase system component IIA